MRNVVLAVVLHGSIFGLFVLFLLWNAGKFDSHDPGQPPPVQSEPVHSSGTLPVVPVLQPADPLRESLADDLREGRVECVDGYYARRVVSGTVTRTPCLFALTGRGGSLPVA